MLREKPLCFLMSFGHCGIDWLHSLLDSHPKILIMPAFSFYRSWKIIGANNANNAEEMLSLWRTYIEKHEGMQLKRRKLFYNAEEAEKFYYNFHELMKSDGIGQVGVFWAIHEAYAYAKQIDTSRIAVVVAQEHLPFYFERMLVDFPQVKLLMIMRDPRAVMAGSFHGLTKSIGYLSDYHFNIVTEFTMHSQTMWKKYHLLLGNRLKIVRNEDLHADLEGSMRDLSIWLEVDFSESMLHSTFSGIPWVGESSYIPEEEKYPEPLDIYYLPENIRARWMGALNDKQIVMIEFLTDVLIKSFGYERITKDTLLSRIKGLVIYILPHRGLVKRWLKTYPDLHEFNQVAHKLGTGIKGDMWKLLPRPLKFLSLIISTVLHRIRIFYFPGDRSKRYF